MAKPLDGIAFLAYCHRLKLSKETQDVLIGIRTSPPSRTPGARRGNMPVWYPSKKMQCIIKAESHKVEFAFLLQVEHDDNVLEVWDQPPSIRLEYHDQRGRTQRPFHTADYFLFRRKKAGWVECKPTQELIRQARTRPNRYQLDEQGKWRCPPGEEYAAKYGLFYEVYASDQINWAAQDNWLFLEDYYQNLDLLQVADVDFNVLSQIVREQPGILLSDLRLKTEEMDTDAVNIAIAKHALYVDLTTYRLSEPWRTPVFLECPIAENGAHDPNQLVDEPIAPLPVTVTSGAMVSWGGQQWQIADATPMDMTLVREGSDPFLLARSAFEALMQEGKIVQSRPDLPSNFTREGQALLDAARDVDSAIAVFRNRVIHPDQYDDDEQTQIAERAAAIPERTKRYWRQLYREAESLYGSGLIGLLPQFARCGRVRDANFAPRKLIHEVLETHYDTVARKPKRGAYGEYLLQAKEQQLNPLSPRTFYREIELHKTAYEQTVAREGTRAAYPFKDYVREQEKTMSRHGNYCWAMAHLDHTELDLMLCDSRTGQPLGKCWLTLLILSHPRRIAAFYLTFDPPSYRSCLAVLRLCVKRYGRLPTAITVDGGPEFASTYFEQLLALYCVRKHQRPAAEPRYGSPQERLFGTMDTSFIYHLLGNTQAIRESRQLTKATDPERLAVWTLPKLAEQVQRWADEEYDTIRHPALGMTPRDAYELSIKRDGERAHKHIEYDDAFLKATFPTTKKGKAKVEPGVGVRMNYLEYWCEAMRDATVEGTQVKVRYDPFDVSVGFAYIDGQWRKCDCPYTEFAGCTERELQLLTEELRRRNRLQYGREHIEISQEQLATFRRENVEIEKLLRQQQNDRETKAALVVLEGGRKRSETSLSAPPVPSVAGPSRSSENKRTSSSDVPEKKPGKLLVFRRIPS
jgi:putative transposase